MQPLSAGSAAPAAGLVRRFLSLLYEALLLIAVLLAAMFPAVILVHTLEPAARRHLIQLYVVVVSAAYFIPQWAYGGQTLAMKTWRVKLVRHDGSRIGFAQALWRFLCALAGLAAFGAGFLWAFIDRDRQFLHDRLSGTRLVQSAGRSMESRAL